jgi:pimeloyl-ACP methyl ester carboxylesterase
MTSSSLAPALPAKTRHLETRFGRIAYWVTGSGPTVLLLHSINAAASSMEIAPLFEGLASGHRVIAIDWLGFGLSDRPDIDYRPLVFEAVLDAALDRLGGDQVDVVALSLPAQYVAARLVRKRHPIRRFAAISPTGVGRFGEARGSRTWRRTVETFLRLPVTGSVLYGLLRSRPSIDWFLDRIVADRASLPAGYRDYAWQTSHQPGALHAPIAFVSGLLDDPRAPAAWRQVGAPTLLLFGDQPRFSDPGGMADAVADSAHVRVETIPDSGDLPHWEQTDRTLSLIQEFLANGSV